MNILKDLQRKVFVSLHILNHFVEVMDKTVSGATPSLYQYMREHNIENIETDAVITSFYAIPILKNIASAHAITEKNISTLLNKKLKFEASNNVRAFHRLLIIGIVFTGGEIGKEFTECKIKITSFTDNVDSALMRSLLIALNERKILSKRNHKKVDYFSINAENLTTFVKLFIQPEEIKK